MKNWNLSMKRIMRHILPSVCFAALGVALMIAPAQADGVTPPAVPADIAVPAGNVAYLIGHAIGTQNYVCLPSGSGVAFVLFTPEATLFDGGNKQIITHYFSPNLNPLPGQDTLNTIRATWQSQDTSTVWAKATGTATRDTDPTFVAAGAVARLRLQVVGAQNGPTGGARLSSTTFIQRVNISGGLAPSTGCTTSADIGHEAFQPYTADYVFFRAAGK
jgi:hypothetical protein